MLDERIMERVTKDPFANLLGVKVVEIAEGYAQVSMDVTDSMQNIHKTANGGVIFSLADIAFAIASNTYEQTAVGINVNINYISAAFANDKLIATAVEVSKNPRLGFYRMEVKNDAGQLIATADGMVYRKKA